MKSKWSIKRLSEVAEIQMGQSPKGSSYNISGEGVPLINGPVEFGETPFSRTKRTKFTTEPTKMCKAGDLILCVRGSTTGRMNIAGYDSCIGRGVASIRSEKYQDWINFFIHVNRETIYCLGSGATFPNVSGSMLAKLEIPIPPESEQKRIVAILDETFEGIDRAIANTEKNLTNSHKLFESYLSAIFTQKSNGWVEKKLGDLCEVQSGGTPLRSKPEYWSGQVAWYSSGELNDLYTTAPERNITDKGLKNSNAKLFPKGSLLIGMYDTAALKMSILDRKAAFNQAIAGVKPNDKIDLFFILHAINFVKPEILSLRRGVRQKNLSLQKIKDIVLAVPELQEQQRVVRQLASMREETQRLETIYRRKIAALKELKQSILQKAFTGELTADIANQTTKAAQEVNAA